MKERFLSITLTIALVLSTLVGTFVTADAETTTGSTAVTHRKKAVTVLDFEKSKPGQNSSGGPAIAEDGQAYKIEAYGNGKDALSVHSSADEQGETGFPKDATAILSFDSYNSIDENKLKPIKDNWFGYNECSLETDPLNVYSGSGKSLKFSWNDGQVPRLRHDGFFNKSGNTIGLWIKSETAFNATIAFSEAWGAARQVVVPIAVGENIIKLKYTDFEGYTGGSICQFRIDAPVNGPAGTIWIDQLCTFTENAAEGSSFVYGGEGQSLHYHTDKANSGYNGIKFNFTKIPLTDKNGNKWGKDSTICIWLNSQRSVPVFFSAQDSEQWHGGAATWWKTDEMTIPAGISVLRIPVSRFNTVKTQGTREDLWDYLGSLNIEFPWAADNSAYDLYIDQIAVEYPTIGDANDDESIDLKDLVTIKKKLASATAPEIIKAIDVNGDGLFDGNDLVTFRKYLLGAGSLADRPLPDGYTFLEPVTPKAGYSELLSVLPNGDDKDIPGVNISGNSAKTTLFDTSLKITMGDLSTFFSEERTINYYVSWNTALGKGSPVNIGDAVENGYFEFWVKTSASTDLRLIAVGEGWYPLATLDFTTSDSNEWQKITLPVAEFKDGGRAMHYNNMPAVKIAAVSEDTFITDGESLELGRLTFFCPTEDIGSSGAGAAFPISEDKLTTYNGENFLVTSTIDSAWSPTLKSSYNAVAKDDPNYAKFKNIMTVKLTTAADGFEATIEEAKDKYGRVHPVNLNDYIKTGTLRTYIKVEKTTELQVSLRNGYAHASNKYPITKTVTVDPQNAVDGYVELQIPIKDFYDIAVKDNIPFRFDKFDSIFIKPIGTFSEADELTYSNIEVWAKGAPAPSPVDNTASYACSYNSEIALIDANNVMPAATAVKVFHNTADTPALTSALRKWSASAQIVDNYCINAVSVEDTVRVIAPNGNVKISVPLSYLYENGAISAASMGNLKAAFYSGGAFKNAALTIDGEKMLIETSILGDLVFFTGNGGADGTPAANNISVRLVSDHPGVPGYAAVYETKIYNGEEELTSGYSLSSDNSNVVISGNTVTLPAEFKDNTELDGVKIYATVNGQTAFYPLMIKKWTLTLQDDFDGDKLNNEIWSNSSDSADCISVNGGKLTMKITADENKEKREPYITTRNKFSQQYGCFTARMLMPKTTETSVSAFWLLPSNYNNNWGTSYLFEGTNLSCGEVDIIEYPSNWNGEAQSALQWWNPTNISGSHSATSQKYKYDKLKNGEYIDATGIWTADALYFYYDGILQGSITNISATGEKACMILSMSTWSGEFNPKAVDSLYCTVDYVKAYK